MEKHDIKEFIIKYSLVSSIIVWIIGNQFFLFNKEIISLLVEPFFSIDLNDNGEPDLKELVKYTLNIGKIKIPIGKIVLETIKLVLQILFVYGFLKIVIKYTNLVNFRITGPK
jgi:hypothetical protein